MGAELTEDAVVVVPGIMGSALRDRDSGELIWGLRPGWYARAWRTGGPGMWPLAVSEDDLAGRVSGVEAVGLLKFAAFAPILAGLEPYSSLVREITKVVRHPSAVLEFAYDWRLPVAHNAALLAIAIQDHLWQWRKWSDRPQAQVVLVAHSMGGLLCRAMAGIGGALDGVRTVITLGTPFDGAAKVAVILNAGRGAPLPLPAQKLRQVAVTMPGVHELLPSYRCLDDGLTVWALTPADVRRFGGNEALARDVFNQRAQQASLRLPHHRVLIGVAQPTPCTLTMDAGVVTAHDYTFRPEGDDLRRHPSGIPERFAGRGDGTVPRNSALPYAGEPMPLAQQHATLASSDEACQFVRDILVHGEADAGPRLGLEDGVGLAAPDVVPPNTERFATLTGIEPHHACCTITEADTGQLIDHPQPHRRDGRTQVAIVLPAPGLYRIRIDGGPSPVSQLIMADDPDE